VHREAVGGIPDPRTVALLEEVLAEPGIPPAWRTPDFGRTLAPVVPVHFRKGELDVSSFSLVTTVGTPQDVTLQEIRIECFFPADATSAEHRGYA
jgi:transcription regulator MmyB-like protein